MRSITLIIVMFFSMTGCSDYPQGTVTLLDLKAKPYPLSDVQVYLVDRKTASTLEEEAKALYLREATKEACSAAEYNQPGYNKISKKISIQGVECSQHSSLMDYPRFSAKRNLAKIDKLIAENRRDVEMYKDSPVEHKIPALEAEYQQLLEKKEFQEQVMTNIPILRVKQTEAEQLCNLQAASEAIKTYASCENDADLSWLSRNSRAITFYHAQIEDISRHAMAPYDVLEPDSFDEKKQILSKLKALASSSTIHRTKTNKEGKFSFPEAKGADDIVVAYHVTGDYAYLWKLPQSASGESIELNYRNALVTSSK